MRLGVERVEQPGRLRMIERHLRRFGIAEAARTNDVAAIGMLCERAVSRRKSRYIADDRPQQSERLRTYLEEGGMLLANADCGGAGFSKTIRDWGEQQFPGYTFRELPDVRGLLSMGATVEVLDPPEARAELTAVATELAALYGARA